jgi:D-alanyl-D-alanine carboxypeptidase (penicillin-binding protein 5/6)
MSAGPRGRGSHSKRGAHSHRRHPSLRAVAVTGSVVALIGVAGVGVQLFRGTPTLGLTAQLASSLSVPGTVAAVPWPGQGEATLGIQGVGTIGSVGGDRPLPIASITKVMTAYVVLHDHPLALGADGPSIALTPTDLANYQRGSSQLESELRIALPESLSEYQALQGLLIPSANDIALTLANWDAGSVPAFVAKMNADAAAMGLHQTHFVDPVGIDPNSVSTTSDLVVMGEQAMANPVFSQIVAQPQADLPVVGLVHNFDALVGHQGIIGIKTGSTLQAGGCFLFAAQRVVAGKTRVVIGAVLDQRGPSIIQAALNAASALVNAAPGAVGVFNVLPAGTQVATVHVPWGHDVAVVSSAPAQFVGWPGLRVSTSLVTHRLGHSLASGSTIGTVTLTLGSQTVTIPAKVVGAVAGPPTSWRLTRP